MAKAAAAAPTKSAKSGDKSPRGGRRADAVRNRQHVLEVAQAVFAELGLSVPIDEIAKRAGVGVGTVYRHFPTKEALFGAILQHHMERIADHAEALMEKADAGAALFELLHTMARESHKKKDFIHALGGYPTGEVKTAKKRFVAAFDALVKRAQRAKELRADVTAEDVIMLSKSVFSSGEQDEATRTRRLGVLFDGLRATASAVKAAKRAAKTRGC
ncbi:MAG: TetR/AcrR family transcriptional regulator [Polyangiaceae bacterium]|nr:TetR/AcrR family transcriptional regulator [Polyangiaceae bacterium]MCB9607446.1 TetR/AcrR family transcriptional regulator [Polyangiaceae bacterium]